MLAGLRTTLRIWLARESCCQSEGWLALVVHLFQETDISNIPFDHWDLLVKSPMQLNNWLSPLNTAPMNEARLNHARSRSTKSGTHFNQIPNVTQFNLAMADNTCLISDNQVNTAIKLVKHGVNQSQLFTTMKFLGNPQHANRLTCWERVG